MIRVSDVSAWAACEQYGLEAKTEPSKLAAATMVGSYAHSLVTGHELDWPERITYDRLTPTMRVLGAQARALAEAAKRELETSGWVVLDTEQRVGVHGLSGHYDLRAAHVQGGSAIIDFKTGVQVGAGWLQVGGYLDLYAESTGRLPAFGAILHVPRVAISKDPVARLDCRPAFEVATAWRVWKHRIAEVLDGGLATRSPGLHCRQCPDVDCPVRTC